MCEHGPRQVRIADSGVMGRTPVLVLASILAVVGLAQITGDNAGSGVVSRYGGTALDVVWSLCLIVAAVLVWTARMRSDRLDGALIETAGIFLMVAGLVVYLLALGASNSFEGAGLILGLVVSTILNVSGRAVLLHRRAKELRKAVR